MDDVHPIRVWRVDQGFRRNLDDLRVILKRGRKKFPASGDGIQMMEMPLTINRDLIDSFESLQGHLFKRDESAKFFLSFLKFWDHYRQIFAFNPTLVDALSATEIADVPWSELRLPHPEFYLSLGDYGQDSFPIRDFEYVIDGAYVRHVSKASQLFPSDTLLFHFTSRLVRSSYREAKQRRQVSGLHFAEPIYHYCVSGEGCHTIGEAIARGESDYLAYCRQQDALVLDAARELAHEFGVMPFGERLQFHQRKFERGRTTIHEAIAPLFNAIFYLTACPEHREIRFPKSAPVQLVQSLQRSVDPAAKKAIRSQIAKKGFSEIIFVRDPELSSEGGPVEETGRHVRAHWRRGHWRNQPYGSNLALRRWLWIRPVLVKSKEALSLGAIHKVREDGAA